jgi:hypothetical protein
MCWSWHSRSSTPSRPASPTSTASAEPPLRPGRGTELLLRQSMICSADLMHSCNMLRPDYNMDRIIYNKIKARQYPSHENIVAYVSCMQKLL